MIIISPIKTNDEENYNYIRCPISKHKLGWKHKNTKVRATPLQADAEYSTDGLILHCSHCNNDFLITIKSNN